jgi:8-oxo-dGTP pyrophosphatase MutT (NUDIX family)
MDSTATPHATPFADGEVPDSGPDRNDTMAELRWNTLESTTEFSCRIFTIHRHRRSNRHRRGDFYVLTADTWCNIIPITVAGEVVMVEQFRHGTQDITLEIPGGIVDPEDESALAAARREMLEECGYDSSHIEPLGFVHPNPAILNNTCHSFVAYDARPAAAQRPDDLEELRIRHVPLAAVPSLILNGTISHALVVSAFAQFFLQRADFAMPSMSHQPGVA